MAALANDQWPEAGRERTEASQTPSAQGAYLPKEQEHRMSDSKVCVGKINYLPGDDAMIDLAIERGRRHGATQYAYDCPDPRCGFVHVATQRIVPTYKKRTKAGRHSRPKPPPERH